MDINIFSTAIMYQEKQTPALKHVLRLWEVRAFTLLTGASICVTSDYNSNLVRMLIFLPEST